MAFEVFRKGIARENTGRLKKSDWILIGCSWLIIQLILLKFRGIYDQEESIKYISLADRWMKGDRNINLYYIFYSGYTAIYVLLRSVGLPFKTMYGVQLILSAMAVFYYIKTLFLFINSRFAIVVSAILFATCYIIQQWVSILFTDSVFCSLLVIATYFLLTEQRPAGNKWIFWILLISLPFFRPVGFLFIMIACFHWCMLSPAKNLRKILLCVACLLMIGVVVYITFEPSEPYYYPIHSLHNIQANVICGYPGDLLKYSKVPYMEGMSVFSFLYHNAEMTARLFSLRFYKVFSMSRSYFSPRHNLLLSTTTFIYYVLAVIGLIIIIRHKKRELYFTIAGILIFSLPMVIFCVEWSGRFSLPVIFYTLLLSSLGIDRLTSSSNS